MKRSQINAAIDEAIGFLREHHVTLPPFAYWSYEDYLDKGAEYDEIRDAMLGWDITDYGSGDFDKVGLLLFTLRNGNEALPQYTKPYAEKVLLSRENQVTPFHFHWRKMEDIINRAGGNLMVRVYNATDDDRLADTPVAVAMDGRRFTVPAGTILRLTPGESITLPPRQYHEFWAEEGHGMVLVGEVSKVNDDRTDNRFLEDQGRFPAIEEDEPIRHPLFSEVPKGR